MEIVEVARAVCGPYFPPDRGPREVSGGFGLRDRHAVPERLLRRDRELVPEADSLRACGGPQPRRRRTHHEGCRRKGVRQGSHHPAQHHQSPCRDAPRHFFSKFRSRQVTNRAASALLLCLARDMVEPGVHEEGQQHCSRCRPRSDRLSSRRTPRAVLSFHGPARLCSSLPRPECVVWGLRSTDAASERLEDPAWFPPRMCFPPAPAAAFLAFAGPRASPPCLCGRQRASERNGGGDVGGVGEIEGSKYVCIHAWKRERERERERETDRQRDRETEKAAVYAA